MSNEPILPSESGARRWYGRLINLYPGAFRDRYAAEMIQVFQESWSRVNNQGAIARWRYWLHVLFDLVRTLPGEWLAAMPAPTKAGLLVVGIAVSLCVIDHQWLTIAMWLFFCAFMIVCWTLIRPSRRGIQLSLLLALALGWAGFGITTLLAKFIPGSHDHQPNTAVYLSVLTAMFIASLCQINSRVRYPWEIKQSQRPLSKDTFRQVLPVLPIIGIVLSQLQIEFRDSHFAGAQAVLACFLWNACATIASGQLAVIWRGQNQDRKPDSAIRPA